MYNLLILILIIALADSQLSTMTINLSSDTVSAVTDYTIEIQKADTMDIPASTTISILFPLQYQSILTTGTYNCMTIDWPFTATLSCTISGLTLTVNGGFPNYHPDNGIENYYFVLQSVKNPPYSGYTDIFTGSIIDPTSAVLISMQSNSGSGILIQQGIMSCSITANPTKINTQSIITFLIDPLNNIPSDGKLVISTSAYWTRDVLNSSKIFNTSTTLQCNPSSNTASNILCSLIQIVDIQTTEQITVTNILNSSSNAAFAFTMTPILTPPTTQPQGSFTIESRFSNDSKIDVCTNVKITGITPGSLSSPSFSMNSTTVNSFAQANINFKLSAFIISSDTISIAFPSTLTLNITNVLVVNGNRQISNPTVSGQTLSFTGISASQGTALIVQVTSIKNPPSITTTSVFSISTMRNNYAIDTLSQSITYTATTGTLTAILSAGSLQLGATTLYTLLITLSDPITSTGMLIITFPVGFSEATGNYICTSTASTNVSCQYNNFVMVVTDIANSGLAAGSSVTLVISSIINPLALGTFQSLSIQTTYSGSSDTVDVLSTGLSLTIITRALPVSNVVISCNVNTVYTLSTFSFVVNNQNPIPSNSYLYVVIPSQITISSSFTCSLGSMSVMCDIQTIQSNSALRIALANSASIASSALQSSIIKINNLYTPQSTKQTSTFKLYIVWNDNTISQQLINGLFFQASSPRLFSSMTILVNTTQNYADSAYTVQFTSPFVLPSTILTTIVFPMTAGSICSSSTPSLTISSCTASNNILTATITTINLTILTFTVSGMKSYLSFQQYSIAVNILSADGSAQILSESYSLVNTVANIITIDSVAFTNTILQTANSLTIQFTPTTPLLNTDYVLITMPTTDFTINNLTCSVPIQLSCTPTANRVKITSLSSFTSTMSVTVSGFTNPSGSPSSGIYIQTYTTEDYLKDQDSSVKFQTSCNLYCRTCLASNASYCLTCYSDSTLVGGYTVFSNNTCTTGCNSGQYLSASSICLSCSANCTSCIAYSTCTSCPANYYLYSGVCLSSCLDGYYKNNIMQICSACSTALHCLTCNTSLQCTSCMSGYYYYSGVCLTQCPSLISTADFVMNVCQQCPTNCSQCSSINSSLAVMCTKCLVGYLLDQDGCYLTCQTIGFVRSTNGLTCVSCNSVCLTCSGSEYSCLTCNTTSINKYFFNNNCLSACSGGYYADNSTFTCQICTSPCETCTSASVSSCSSCITGNYLYNGVCGINCPVAYFQNGAVCTACQPPCLQCTALTVCTSCINGMYLYSGGCVFSCPTNMLAQSGVCVACSSNCNTCQGLPTICSSCYYGFYLLAGVCNSLCSDGYYANSNGTCQACVAPCSKCSSTIVCITCVSGFNLDGSSCVMTCSVTRIPINSVCTPCASQCLTCVTSTTICTSCQPGLLYTQAMSTCTSTCSIGYLKYLTDCISNCPTGTYNSSNECVSCPALCTSCISASNCSFCSSGYFYSNMCYTSCPAQAPYPQGQNCITCSITNCIICSGILCSVCSSNYLLIQGTSCISNCSTGLTYNSTSKNCQNQTINNTNNTNNSNNTNNNDSTTTSAKLTFLPMPITIVAVLLTSIILLSKLQHQNVKFVPSLLPIISFSMVAAATTNLVVTMLSQSSWMVPDVFMLISGLAFIVCLNVTCALVQCTQLPSDDSFQSFIKDHCCGVTSILTLGILTTFKWALILHSNLFGFSLCGLTLSTSGYHKKLVIHLWISLLSNCAFLGSGGVSGLKYNYTDYLFYGGIQLIILSLAELGLTIAAARAPQPISLKYKQTLSLTHPIQIRMDGQSRNQIYSQQNNLKDITRQPLNSNPLNIFDVANGFIFEQPVKKRAQSAQTPPKQQTDAQDAQYQSALQYPKDTARVEKNKIGEAIQKGIFRYNAKSILQIKKKEEDESALADAAKLYRKIQMKKRTEQQMAKGIIVNQSKANNYEAIKQVQAIPVTNHAIPLPSVAAIKATSLIQKLEEESELAEIQPSSEQQLKVMLFDDAEEEKSAPTHISKEMTSKQQKKGNSLGSLALIIEEEDAIQQIDQINLEQIVQNAPKSKKQQQNKQISQIKKQKTKQVKKPTRQGGTKNQSLRSKFIVTNNQHQNIKLKAQPFDQKDYFLDVVKNPIVKQQSSLNQLMESPNLSNAQNKNLAFFTKTQQVQQKQNNHEKFDQINRYSTLKKQPNDHHLNYRSLEITYREEPSQSLPDSEFQDAAKKQLPIIPLQLQKNLLKSKLQKQIQQQFKQSIIVQKGNIHNDDLQSIFTVQDKDYVELRQTIDINPRAWNEERIVLEQELNQDLIKPSQLFKSKKIVTFSKADNSTVSRNNQGNAKSKFPPKPNKR